MSQFFNSPAFFYALMLGFAAYTAYYLWNVFRFLKGNYDARRQYYAKYGKEGARKVNQFWAWVAVFSIMVAYCIYSAITVPGGAEQAEWFRMAFLFVGLILFGQMLVAAVKRSALIGPEAFVVDDAVLTWKSVLSMDPKQKGIQRIVELLTTKGKFTLSREMGIVIHEEYEKWRAAKKDKKEKKGK